MGSYYILNYLNINTKMRFWIIIGLLTLLFCWLLYPQEFANQETYLAVSSYMGRVTGFFSITTNCSLNF